ncbi:MAG: F0F1 ATP synthase subunit epsilon [Candidatus Dojkabacteria bacterium]|nr:F0F1 ATP synthase subunit epsilon [Candidatus Dojkabacteria bacterium]
MQVNIYTTGKVLLENTNIQSVYLPTVTGDIEIYDNHVPIISKLKPGTLKLYYYDDPKPIFVQIEDGFLVFRDNCLNIIITKTNITLEELREIEEQAIRKKDKNIGLEDHINEKDALNI